jgi:hypothetical protein
MPRGVCMNRSTVLPRCALMMTAAVGGLLATAAAAPAQVETKYETYTATAANLSVGSGEALRINVFRWSSDDERQKALSALGEKGDKGLPGALASAPSAGYLWTSETLGYTLRYAYKQALPAGGERVILLTDRRLGSWSRVPWSVAATRDAGDDAFTVIELRLNRAGVGEGKMSFATKVAADHAAGTIALDNYDTAPILLKNVKHEPRRDRPR